MVVRTLSAVFVLSLLASADAVEVARRRRVRAGKSGTQGGERPGDLGGERAGALQAWSSEGDHQVVESVAALEVSASIEPVTAMLLVTGVVHLVSAGINAYRHHHASNFVASMRDVQEQIVSESLARCVQARTTVFQVRLFDTAVGVYAAHAGGLAASSPDAAGRLSELSANFNTLKRDLAPILRSMSGAACNADPQAARRLHDHAKTVEANEENLKKIAKSVVQELTGALLTGVSLAIPLAVEGGRQGAGQSALAAGGHGSHSPVERIIATFTDGKGDLFSDLTETLHHFAHLAEFTVETHHQVVKICQTTIEGYVRSTFQTNVVGTFLNGARTLVALSATVAHLIGAAAGAALTTAATSLGLAVAVWTLGSSVRAGLRENAAFSHQLTSSRVNAVALGAHADYRQCLAAAGALDVGSRQHALMNDYEKLLQAVGNSGSSGADAAGLAKQVGKELEEHCRFHVHLCKTGLVGDPKIWAALKPIMPPDFAGALEHRSLTGPITDFAVSTDPAQAEALEGIGFELALHKPIGKGWKTTGTPGRRRGRRREQRREEPMWLWQCRMCSKRAVTSVKFLSELPDVGSGAGLIAVGEGNFVQFDTTDAAADLAAGKAVRALRSLRPREYDRHFFGEGSQYVVNDAAGRHGTVEGFFSGEGNPWGMGLEGEFGLYVPGKGTWSGAGALRGGSGGGDAGSGADQTRLITAWEICHDPVGQKALQITGPRMEISVGSGRWYKFKKHGARTGDYLNGGDSHIRMKTWQVSATRSLGYETAFPLGGQSYCERHAIAAEKHIVALRVCDKTESQWMYMSCAEMQASGNWVEIEATLQDPKAKAEGFDDGKDPLRTSFALYGRMSATRVSQQEGGGPSASTGGLNLMGSGQARQRWQDAKRGLQCTVCGGGGGGGGAGGGEGACTFRDLGATGRTASPEDMVKSFPLREWFDGVGMSSCAREEVAGLEDLLRYGGGIVDVVPTLADVQAKFPGFGDGRVTKKSSDFHKLLTQLHSGNCRARFFVPVKHAGDCTREDQRAAVFMSAETGRIVETCAVGGSGGSEVYFVEVVFNADNRGAKEAPVVQGPEAESAWAEQWWAQPVEFTHGGPYDAYEPSTPRNVHETKKQDPAWGSYSIMSGQYLTMRIWARADLRLPRHYAKRVLCEGFDGAKDCA